MKTGMQFIAVLSVTEPLRYEYAASKRLTGLIRLSIMEFKIAGSKI
jgi:hypothetical protein